MPKPKKPLGEVLHTLPLLIQNMHLMLPASERSIARQIDHLSKTLFALDECLQQVLILRDKGNSSDYQNICSQLAGFLQELMAYTDILIHLAKEHAVDPEGTARCLVDVMVDDVQFLRQVSYFQTAIAQCPRSPFAQWLQALAQPQRKKTFRVTASTNN